MIKFYWIKTQHMFKKTLLLITMKKHWMKIHQSLLFWDLITFLYQMKLFTNKSQLWWEWMLKARIRFQRPILTRIEKDFSAESSRRARMLSKVSSVELLEEEDKIQKLKPLKCLNQKALKPLKPRSFTKAGRKTLM